MGGTGRPVAAARTSRCLETRGRISVWRQTHLGTIIGAESEARGSPPPLPSPTGGVRSPTGTIAGAAGGAAGVTRDSMTPGPEQEWPSPARVGRWEYGGRAGRTESEWPNIRRGRWLRRPESKRRGDDEAGGEAHARPKRDQASLGDPQGADDEGFVKGVDRSGDNPGGQVIGDGVANLPRPTVADDLSARIVARIDRLPSRTLGWIGPLRITKAGLIAFGSGMGLAAGLVIAATLAFRSSQPLATPNIGPLALVVCAPRSPITEPGRVTATPARAPASSSPLSESPPAPPAAPAIVPVGDERLAGWEMATAGATRMPASPLLVSD